MSDHNAVELLLPSNEWQLQRGGLMNAIWDKVIWSILPIYLLYEIIPRLS